MCNLTRSFFFRLFFWVTSEWLFKSYIIGGIRLVSSRKWRLPNYRNRIIINSLNFDLRDDMWLILIVSITPRWCVIDPHKLLLNAFLFVHYCYFQHLILKIWVSDGVAQLVGIWICGIVCIWVPSIAKEESQLPLKNSDTETFFFFFLKFKD